MQQKATILKDPQFMRGIRKEVQEVGSEGQNADPPENQL
jgi:hypothetical protein